MPRITVDGVDYVPASSAQPLVGVAITTRNRPDVLADSLAAFAAESPDVPVVVVDDGSDTPVVVPPGVGLVRHDRSLGIPAAKNRCLTELVRLGCQHLFLFDDDARPASGSGAWWRPYVDSAEPHLQHCWTHDHRNKPVPRMDVVYRDAGLVAFGWSMGCMLYVDRAVVDRVGGLRREFGVGMEEHAEWSQRIHNAGLTSFVHQDVPDSGRLVWAGDRFGAVTRSIPLPDRARLLARNERLRLSLAGDDSFVPFGARDCVVAAYFTSVGDAQRGGKKLPADAGQVAVLVDSVAGCDADLVVLTDCLTDLPGSVDTVTVDAPLSAYVQRWLRYWQWLRDNPDVRFAWLVDATDVRLLNDPFPAMQPNTLYCGWEVQTVGCDWVRSHSPNTADWVEDHAQDMLLNCGVVGGDRATLMRVCRAVFSAWLAGDRSDPCEEMVLFNMAARREPNVVTGIQVTTVFKSGATAHDLAWFAHK